MRRNVKLSTYDEPPKSPAEAAARLSEQFPNHTFIPLGISADSTPSPTPNAPLTKNRSALKSISELATKTTQKWKKKKKKIQTTPKTASSATAAINPCRNCFVRRPNSQRTEATSTASIKINSSTQAHENKNEAVQALDSLTIGVQVDNSSEDSKDSISPSSRVLCYDTSTSCSLNEEPTEAGSNDDSPVDQPDDIPIQTDGGMDTEQGNYDIPVEIEVFSRQRAEETKIGFNSPQTYDRADQSDAEKKRGIYKRDITVDTDVYNRQGIKDTIIGFNSPQTYDKAHQSDAEMGRGIYKRDTTIDTEVNNRQGVKDAIVGFHSPQTYDKTDQSDAETMERGIFNHRDGRFRFFRDIEINREGFESPMSRNAICQTDRKIRQVSINYI